MEQNKELSQHDKELLNKIREIDDEWGWARWPEIAHLAEQLEDEEKKQMWKNTCKHYNHMEEASIGEL